MTITWTTSEQATEGSGVKILVYGDSGLGKTVLCSTMPNPVIISNESGLLSLKKKNLDRIYGEGAPNIALNIPVIQIQNLDDLDQAYAWCTQSAEAKQFESVCLDSLSEIGETILSNAKKLVKDPRQAYGELITETEIRVRRFRDLIGKHVYVAAKMEPYKDELTGVVRYIPSMPGAKLGPRLPYYFDEVFRLGINKSTDGKEFRYLQTQPDLQHVAKDRSGALAPMVYPHLGAIIRQILGG